MRELFKEYLWNSGWRAVLSVVTGIFTIWGIVLVFDPSLSNKVPPLIRADPRIWYGIAIAFLVYTCIWILHKSSQYRKRMESRDNIRFAYNPKRYKPCKEIRDRGSREIYRVGIRAIGNEAVESLIVIPDKLERIDDKSYQRLQISPIKLHPMTDSLEPIYRGRTPSYYVDILSHVIGSSQINMCYDKHPERDIDLPNGQYELTLIARAKPRTNHIGTMVVTMLNGHINIEMRKLDYLGG